MTIRTIKVRQIMMTRREHEAFIEALRQAEEGRTVHSGSVELEDGSQLCVNIESDEETVKRQRAEQEKRHNRFRDDSEFNGRQR
jgi:hypothetical protein